VPGESRRYALLGLGVVAISCAAVLVRLADAPPLVVAAGRLTIASLVLVPWTLLCHRSAFIFLVANHTRLVALAGLFLAVHFALWIASLSYTTVASSVVLVTANPFFVALASYLAFGERLRRATFIGIGLCIGGAALIGYGGWSLGPEALKGDILALLAAMAMAVYLLVGRRLRRTVGLVPYATAVFLVGALVLIIAAVLSGTPLAGYGAKTCTMILLLALVPQLIGHMSLNWALRFLPATMVTVAVLGEPVGATLLAIPVLSESPTSGEIGGALLILAGIVVAFSRGGLSQDDKTSSCRT
jgi:drug/metabolite transporter (DMT)-like permease